MAYTLKSTGLATNLVHCIGVESGAIKDFKSAAITSDMSWVDASDSGTTGTYGSEQWRSATSNGSSHEYFVTSATKFIKFGTNKPTFSLGGNESFFVAYGATGGATGVVGARRHVCDSGSTANRVYINTSGGGGNWIMTASSGAAQVNGATAIENTTITGQHSAVFTSDGVATGNGKVWYDAADDTNASGTGTASRTFQPVYIGCDFARTNWFGPRFFLIAQFDKELNSTEVAALNTDWFGELFEASGTSVAPLAMAHYARMRNG